MAMPHTPASVFMGVSGASGAIYAQRLVEVLAARGCRLSLSISHTGLAVLRHELGLVGTTRATITQAFLTRARADATTMVYLPGDLEAPMSSGSNFPDAAVICPCSMSTVAHIALGTTRTLLHRVGDVALKEGRPLVLVPREMPFSEIHLARMLDARRAGAIVLPGAPGFYHRPTSIGDLVDHVVGKVLSVLGMEQTLFPKWTGPDADEPPWAPREGWSTQTDAVDVVDGGDFEAGLDDVELTREPSEPRG
jgi:4-hydroxy-3-polyprenylbenzoate decarboxylase